MRPASLAEVKKFAYLVDSKLKDETGKVQGKWFKNIPFEIVPRGFIEQLWGHPLSYDEYLEEAPLLNLLPNIWNIGLIDWNNQVIAFQYGYWDSLAKSMELVRLSIHPKLFRISGESIRDCKDAGKELSKVLGVERLYWITCKWKSVLRKLDGEVKLTDARVMEVY